MKNTRNVGVMKNEKELCISNSNVSGRRSDADVVWSKWDVCEVYGNDTRYGRYCKGSEV